MDAIQKIVQNHIELKIKIMAFDNLFSHIIRAISNFLVKLISLESKYLELQSGHKFT